jgi:XTP/dITP diphosphohydrolase
VKINWGDRVEKSIIDILLGTSNIIKKLEIAKFFETSSMKYRIKQFEEKLEIEEIGENFEDIARWKVMKYSENFSDKLFLSDDSGLCVNCLGGRPGIFSARFPYKGVSDEERNYTLLKLLKKTPYLERTATFYSAIAVGVNGRLVASTVGACEGRIICESKGENGFGFDPIFVPNGTDKTFAEMSIEDKLKVSHRGMTLRKILKLLEGEVEYKNEK